MLDGHVVLLFMWNTSNSFKKVLVVIRVSLSLVRGMCGLSLDRLRDWILGGDLVASLLSSSRVRLQFDLMSSESATSFTSQHCCTRVLR